MRDYRMDPLFGQIATKVEELRCGTAPSEITGSTTARAATGLIAGIGLNNVELDDEEAWAMLNVVQKQTVVHFRPVSKYAGWLESDLIQKKLKEASETLEQRAFRERLERSTEDRYVVEIEMRASLAEAIAVLAKRYSVEQMEPFADDEEEAWRMVRAVQAVGAVFSEIGLKA